MMHFERVFSTTNGDDSDMVGCMRLRNLRAIKTLCFVTFMSLTLYGCSTFNDVDVEPVGDVKVRNIDGSLRVPGQKQGFSLFGDKDEVANSQSFPFNLYLWQASLKVIGNIGVNQISAESGTIISEWFASGDGTETQVTVIIAGMDFTSQNLVVRSARRNIANKEATTAGSEAFNAQLKDVVLANARDIRIEKLGPALNSSWW